MICGGKGASRSTCGAIVAEAPDGRFLDKVPGLVEFHLPTTALRVRIAALALLPNVEKQGGCSGLLVFGLFISLFIVNVDFVVHCQIVPRETR
jgi:hypothetical protein